MTDELNELEIKEVQNLAKEKLGLCRKGNDIIGTQIFSILSLYARVIYYPLGQQAPWGFTRISGSSNDAYLEKPFVAINSSIPVDCQVFAAAHELYHIWYEQNPDLLPADLLNEQDKEVSEKKANRFAAEFLIDKQLLYQEIDLYMIREITIESILRLADLFTVPYRTMVKRLWEAEVINDAKLNEFLLETEDSVDKYRKRYSISYQKPDERVAIDNLVDLAVSAYELGHITYEKLEYLLRMSKLEPKDIGIEKKAVYGFPSDDELDSIMEE
ncbi:ImmA/IrrE family metallo-endopeptidase [Lachnospiraceae bacterium WCA-9-b2]|uniref:ImmA/IrrE family metallo-endopeptidase n=1 Tax=Sporofaciens musculi TaxID=2681861 RepID=A0A7X3ME76_9FIRM|nr:ImmA/IrrE family metallo-endopeptidase [Sporofaciens musculi]MXP74718.1 ImmA/IrrE family metallo-endopeptidase [Sporofaciens musculi]